MCKKSETEFTADQFGLLRKFESLEANEKADVTDKQLDVLFVCLDALDDDAFPALDALRLLLTRSDLNSRIVRRFEANLDRMFVYLLEQFDAVPTPYRIMGLRTIVNLFASEAGISFVRDEVRIDRLLHILLKALKSTHLSLRLSAGTALHSYAHMPVKKLSDERLGLVVSALIEAIDEGNIDDEWLFTALIALHGFYESSETAKNLIVGLELDTDRLQASSKQKTVDLAKKFN